jgi:hypothetical protein
MIALQLKQLFCEGEKPPMRRYCYVAKFRKFNRRKQDQVLAITVACLIRAIVKQTPAVLSPVFLSPIEESK